MELKKCSNGHTYDPSITPECPECARLGLIQDHTDRIGKTVPLGGEGGAQPLGKTQPLRRDTMPINNSRQNWEEGNRDWDVSDPYPGRPQPYGPTQPLHPDIQESTAGPIRPVTGWLVCIEGPEKGRDYRLHEEYNYIGRSQEMDVCISDDMTISRKNHAIIAYDDQERMFYFAPSGGSSMVRQNGKVVLSSVELHAGDHLQIGRSTFLFVPLCGEGFQW